MKLNLGSQDCVHDKHVNTLVQRCNKITELDLSNTSISNASLESIIKHLTSLEKLDISYTNINFSALVQLKWIPTLKILRCFGWKKDKKEVKNLKLRLPHVHINKKFIYIACPTKDNHNDQDWFWEIRAKQQDLFPKAELIY